MNDEKRPRQHIWLLIALAAACVLPLIFSADSPWIFDEPQLLKAAVVANHTPEKFLGIIPLPFTILPVGLAGNRGALYGPAAEWFYQIMLAVLPHNLVLLAFVRAALVTILTAAALLWLSRSSGLSLRFAVVIMLSPWLWFYARQLWDNSFCIPLTVLMLGAYASFLKKQSRGAFAVMIVCGFLLPLLHLMTLAFVLPIGVHFLIFHWRSLREYRRVFMAICIVMLGLSLQYVTIFRANYHPNMPGGLSRWQGWVFPLFGGHHLSALGFDDPMGRDWIHRVPKILSWIISGAVYFTSLAYVAVWIGMILALRRAWRVVRRMPDCSVLDHIATICVGVWVCQTVLDGTQRVYDMPHYYNGTWIVYAVFAWLAVDALPRVSVSRVVLPIYSVCQLIVIGFILVRVHIDGGTRSRSYGPTIANQQQVADEIGNGGIRANFPQWKEFPIGFDAIRSLRPQSESAAGSKTFEVSYRNAFAGDARIVAREIPLATSRPKKLAP